MNILKMNLVVAGFLMVLPAAQACGILTVCNADLQQFENDAVSTYLQLHHIPQSESNFVYQYGRADLRNAIRGLMFDDLLRIIQEDPSTRTPHEQAIFDWFKGVVYNLELADYKAAAADADAWKANPCAWKPDPAVAATYGLTYDNTAYCSGDPLVTGFTALQVPSQDYFLGAALKNTYGAAVTNTQYGSATEESLQQEGYLMYGYAAAPAVGLSAASSLATYQYFVNFPKTSTANQIKILQKAASAAKQAIRDAAEAGDRSFTGADDIEAASQEAIDELTSSAAADFAGGPAAIILIAVEIGVEAGFDFIDSEQALDEVNELDGFVSSFESQGVNFQNFLGSDTGMYQLMTAFTAQTLPDRPSAQTLPEHRDGVDPYFVLENPTTGNRTETQTLTYKDLAGTQWSVQTYEGFFLQSGTLTDGTTANSLSPTLTITDPQGTTWAVDWTGSTFLLTKTQPADGDVVCAADPTAGVSIVTNYQTCSSYVAFNFQMQDGTLVSLGQKPIFTNDPIAAIPGGQSFSVNITATGIPTPAIGPAGSIPPGVSVSVGANGSLTLSGSASVPLGTYTIPFQATNGTGTATENFTLVLGATTPQIISANEFNDNGGVATTFTIHAAGNPAPSISLGPDFRMPDGYSFRDNGNGTATISGTDPGGVIYISASGGPENVIGGTVQATNPLGTTSQQLAIDFIPAPSPVVVGASDFRLATTFTPEVNNVYKVITAGATTPVHFTFSFSPQRPGWLSFRDNGDGTATFSGRPPATATPYSVSVGVLPVAIGQVGIELTNTLAIRAAPVFINPADQLMTRCDVNEPCHLSAHTNMASGTLSLSGDVPAGLTLNSDRPAGGDLNFKTATGGAYPITVTATNSYGSTNQIYTFYVRQQPGFPTATGDQLDIWLMAKVRASFSIPTTGYPHDIGVLTPGGAQYLPPMQLTVHHRLPQGISFTDQTAAGVPTGTGLFSGTPAEGSEGDYRVNIEANNGHAANLQVTLHVRMAGDVNNDGQANCTDVSAIRAAMGSYAGQPNYNVLADINNDGAVNVLDLALAAPSLPKGCPLQ